MSDVTDLKAEVLLLRRENKELREDLEFERSENGWAREFLNRMGRKCGTKDCPSLVAYVTKLEGENAKLRDENTELRKMGGFMLRCISQYHDCADCLVNGEHCEISYIEADARELGVVK